MSVLERFTRWVRRDLTYLKVYSATVELDNLDGTFDLTPDDPAMRGQGLSRVPTTVGVAGAAVNASQGTRCLFGFENGDPSRPRIRAWSYAALSGRIAFDGGTARIARRGDYVRCLIGNPAPVAGMLGGTTYTPAPPGAPIPTPVIPAPFTGVVTGILPDTVHGTIIGGARRVKG